MTFKKSSVLKRKWRGMAQSVSSSDKMDTQMRLKRKGLVSFWELPEYMKDNEFILSYYRANWPLKQALFSIFIWHNETLNVWTHLLGFLLFAVLTSANVMQLAQFSALLPFLTRSFLLSASETNLSNNYTFTVNSMNLKQSSSPGTDITMLSAGTARWPFFLFMGGSMFCLLSSSICHLFCCHSHPLNLLLLKIDYVGITIMIVTSFFLPVYYMFQCNPLWQLTYLSGVTILGAVTIATLLSPAPSTGNSRAFRALLFSSMALFEFVPTVHILAVNKSKLIWLGLLHELAAFTTYLIGTMFYVCRIPERWKPGWFDLVGHSHQIFHVFVILGALGQYSAGLVFFQYRDKEGCSLNV